MPSATRYLNLLICMYNQLCVSLKVITPNLETGRFLGRVYSERILDAFGGGDGALSAACVAWKMYCKLSSRLLSNALSDVQILTDKHSLEPLIPSGTQRRSLMCPSLRGGDKNSTASLTQPLIPSAPRPIHCSTARLIW